jgi:hypothetical protein
MTQDDIMRITRMAREAGFIDADEKGIWITDGFWGDELTRFAALVAAYTLSNIDPSKFMSFQEGMEAGCLAEREACAKVCEEHWRNDGNAMECADAIRAIKQRPGIPGPVITL